MMSQNTIVLIIVALTVGWVVFKMIRGMFVPKKASGCGGCTGCDLASRNKSCCSRTPHSFSDKHLMLRR
jgi:hypothetical protein